MVARASALIPVLLLLATAIAGCSGSNTTAQAGRSSTDSIENAVSEVTVHATPTTGVIRGVVVDAAIRPLSKVTLTVATREKTLTTNSTASGAFGFQGLQPGTYLVKAHKVSFQDQQVSVEVVAGVSEPRATKIQLSDDPKGRPYYDAMVFKGFIECSATSPAVGVALCSVPNIGPAIVAILTCNGPLVPGTPPPPCTQPSNITADAFAVRYYPVQTPQWMQSELVWSSTQSLGAELSLAYSYTPGACGGFYCDHGAKGTSPVLVSVNATQVPVVLNQGSNNTNAFVRVFNTDSSATRPPCVNGVCPRGFGVTVEQEFDIYSHFFYGYQPPEGWRFTANSDPPAPT